MDPKQLKRNLVTSGSMLAIVAAVCTQTTKNVQIRTIEFLSILVLGMALGVLIVNLALYIRFRKKDNV
jgi:hypothetical protein